MKTQRKRYSSRVRKNASKRRNSVRKTKRRTKSRRTKSRRNLKGGASNNPFEQLIQKEKEEKIKSIIALETLTDENYQSLFEMFKEDHIDEKTGDSPNIKFNKRQLREVLESKKSTGEIFNSGSDRVLINLLTGAIKSFTLNFKDKKTAVMGDFLNRTLKEYGIPMPD